MMVGMKLRAVKAPRFVSMQLQRKFDTIHTAPVHIQTTITAVNLVTYDLSTTVSVAAPIRHTHRLSQPELITVYDI
jgi:hypothetical protein